MKTWSIQQQQERRQNFYRIYREETAESFSPSGQWIGPGGEPGFREKAWHCIPLLDGTEKDKTTAAGILSNTEFGPCHFTPMTFLQIVNRHRDDLPAAVTGRMEEYIAASLDRASADRIHFTMYNDNFASMAMVVCLLGGHLAGRQDVLKRGQEMLRELDDLLKRCGTLMEYDSPTYTGISLHALSEIVNYPPNLEVKEAALTLEQKMWAEVCARFHAETSRLAGPYSRAYWIDTVGHPHLMNAFMYGTFGDRIFINPSAYHFPPRSGVVGHASWAALVWPNSAWIICSDTHCPDRYARYLFSKPYPVITESLCEGLPSRITGHDRVEGKDYVSPIEWPGYTGPNYTYQTADYAMGTAYSQFHDGGLSESFYVTYRKQETAASLEDTGVVFARYLVNDRLPDRINHYNIYGDASPEGYRDEGRKFGIQEGPWSMMAYKPKHFELNAASLKLSLILPFHFGFTPEVWINGKRTDSLPAVSEEPATVVIRDGVFTAGFRPLTLTNHGREEAVRVERNGDYLYISFYNYKGPEREFQREELIHTSNGFVAHTGRSGENPVTVTSRLEEGNIRDVMTFQEGAYTRWIRFTHPDAAFDFVFSPLSEGILRETVNGKPRSRPVFRSTGLDPEDRGLPG